MHYRKVRLLRIIIFCSMLLLWRNVEASQNYYTLQSSLNSFLYDYAFRNNNNNNIVPRPRTGRLYNLRLPLNFSGIQVSTLRLRTHGLWKNGLNYSSAFEIPPGTLPRPFANRVDLLYQDLGNWSTFYYNVPNYEFVAPVIGLLAFDRSNLSSNEPRPVELRPSGAGSIVVRFENLSVGHDEGSKKCVRFGGNGKVEFTDLTLEGSCVARGQGHFSVVVAREKRVISSKWWIVVGLVFLIGVVVVVVVYKLMQRRKVWKMEKRSGRSEALGARWIGNSKMPTASGIRTQPSLLDMVAP